MVSSVGAVRFILFLYPSPCLLFCCCCRPRHPCSRASQPTEAGKAVTATSILIPGMYIRIYPDLSTVYIPIYLSIFGVYFTRASHGVQPCLGADFQFWKYHGANRCFFFFVRIVRCGAVRCGFHFFRNHMVRFGADFLLDGAVRCGLHFSRIVRCVAVRYG